MPIKPGETVPLTETQRGYVSYLEQYIDRRLSGFKPEDYVVIFDICDSSRVPFTGMKVSQQTRNECDFRGNPNLLECLQSDYDGWDVRYKTRLLGAIELLIFRPKDS